MESQVKCKSQVESVHKYVNMTTDSMKKSGLYAAYVALFAQK